MLRKIAFGAGAAVAALGLAVSVPGAATAADLSTTAASTTSDQVTTQGTWVYVQWYPKTQYGSLQCISKAMSTDRVDECRTKTSTIELWAYYG